jgi:hypothetical protein
MDRLLLMPVLGGLQDATFQEELETSSTHEEPVSSPRPSLTASTGSDRQGPPDSSDDPRAARDVGGHGDEGGGDEAAHGGTHQRRVSYGTMKTI